MDVLVFGSIPSLQDLNRRTRALVHYANGDKQDDLEALKRIQPLEAPMADLREKLIRQTASVARSSKELDTALEVCLDPLQPMPLESLL